MAENSQEPQHSNTTNVVSTVVLGAGSGYVLAKLVRLFGRTMVALFGTGILAAAVAHYYGLINFTRTLTKIGEPTFNAVRAANQGVAKTGAYSRIWELIKRNILASAAFAGGATFALW